MGLPDFPGMGRTKCKAFELGHFAEKRILGRRTLGNDISVSYQYYE